MSDMPNIYPFQRVPSSPKAAVPGATKNVSQHKKNARAKPTTLQWFVYLKVAGMVLAGFLLARAQILGGLYPFAPAYLAACAVIYPKKGVAVSVPVLLGLLTSLWGTTFFAYLAMTAILAVVFSL